MPEMTLAEAAKWAARGKPAILKAIQKGHLSATKADDGTWRIDPSELARVYKPGNGAQDFQSSSQTNQEAAKDAAAVQREIELLREMVARADAVATDLRAERDAWKDEAKRWQSQLEAQVRLLVYEKAEQAAHATKSAKSGTKSAPGLWGRLFGRSRTFGNGS